MAATIKIKNSSTASAIPTSSDLVQGELAVNVTDKRIFTENASGTVVELGTNPTILTLPDGSASSPTLTNDGDTNTGIFFPAADTVGISTGGTERARVDSSGNLGLGVTPSAWGGSYKALQFASGSIAGYSTTSLDIYGNAYDSGAGAWKYQNSSQGATRYANYNGQHQWFNAPTGTAGNAISFTQAMTLDASGNLGVGATSVNGMIHLRRDTSSGSSTSYPNIRIDNPNASGYTGLYFYADTTQKAGFEVSNSAGALQMLVANAERARIDSSGNFSIASGNLTVGGATSNIYMATGSERTISASGSANATALTFKRWTGASYNSDITMDGSGNLLVGTTTLNGSGGTTISATNGGQPYILFNATQTTNEPLTFRYNGTTVGKVTQTTSATSYVTSSDYRLKEDVAPMVDALEKVALLKPVTYKWKIDGSEGQGFIAHELQSVVPDAVVGEKDDVDEDGNPVYQGIDTSFLVATLTAAIQEQQAIIQTLTQRIEALEQA